MRTCASNCFRRGDADARITLLPRRAFRTGRSSGKGRRGGWEEGREGRGVVVCVAVAAAAAAAAAAVAAATSYEGGKSGAEGTGVASSMFWFLLRRSICTL